MSAPRKIWIIEDGKGLRRHLVSVRGEVWGNDPSANAYHHDDVVRELMEYVGHKRNCALMRAFVDGKVCTCGFDAALAKIAQHA